MEVHIAARHAELSDAMREYAEEKARRLADHFDFLTDVKVTLTFEKKRHVAEFIASCHKHDPVVASASGEDLYGTMDRACDRVMVQLRRQKERIKSHRVQKPYRE